MSSRNAVPSDADPTSLALHDYSGVLTRALPPLLFSRDRELLVRWCKVRSWIDNAIAGDLPADFPAIDLAVSYLATRAVGASGSS
jgi:hypothetical protein